MQLSTSKKQACIKTSQSTIKSRKRSDVAHLWWKQIKSKLSRNELCVLLFTSFARTWRKKNVCPILSYYDHGHWFFNLWTALLIFTKFPVLHIPLWFEERGTGPKVVWLLQKLRPLDDPWKNLSGHGGGYAHTNVEEGKRLSWGIQLP